MPFPRHAATSVPTFLAACRGVGGRGIYAVALCAAIIAGGCDGNALERVPVQGTVEFDGKPLAWGAILFTPLPGTSGPRAAGQIKDGAFSLDEEEGPVVGKHRVAVWSDISPAMHRDVKREGPLPETVDIPPCYNERSTLEIEATAAGPNQYHFRLKSQP